MPATEKFLFEVSFDEEELARAEAEAAEQLAAEQADLMKPEEDLPTFTEEQVDAARDEGYDAGREAGIKEAADAIETKINDALGMIGNQIDDLFKRQVLDTASTFTDAINIAVAISRKCFPYLNDTHGFPEIERMVREVMTEVLEEPRVIIHINPSLKEALDDRITTLAKDSNFEGQVIILEAEEIAPGDCRIAWSSGTAERDMAGTLGKIDQIVEANLGSVKEDVAEDIDENDIHVDSVPTPEAAPDLMETDSETPTMAEEPSVAPETAGTMPANTDMPADSDAEISAETESVAEESPTDALTGAEHPETTSHVSTPPSADPGPETLEADPDGAPPTPSSELMEEPFNAAESLTSEPLEMDPTRADQPSEEDIMSAGPPVSEEEREAITAAHLQAGPGNVEEESNEVILEPTPEPPAVEEDRALDEDRDSAPPRGPNR